MRQHGLVHGRNTPLQTLRTETNLKSLADGDMMADTKRQTRTDADPKFWNPHIPGYHPSSKDDVTKLSRAYFNGATEVSRGWQAYADTCISLDLLLVACRWQQQNAKCIQEQMKVRSCGKIPPSPTTKPRLSCLHLFKFFPKDQKFSLAKFC